MAGTRYWAPLPRQRRCRAIVLPTCYSAVAVSRGRVTSSVERMGGKGLGGSLEEALSVYLAKRSLMSRSDGKVPLPKKTVSYKEREVMTT